MDNQIETLNEKNASDNKSCFLGLFSCIPLIHYQGDNMNLIQKKETEERKFNNISNKFESNIMSLSNRQYTIQKSPGIGLNNQNEQFCMNRFITMGKKSSEMPKNEIVNEKLREVFSKLHNREKYEPKESFSKEEKEKASLNSSKRIGSQFTLFGKKAKGSKIGNSKSSILSVSRKILFIEVFVEGTETPALKIEIKHKGMTNSTRNDQDGITYFGDTVITDKNETNDCVLNYPNSGIESRHFLIKYIEDYNEYFLKNLSLSAGTFVKVEEKIELKQNDVISYNNCHLIIGFKFEKIGEKACLNKISFTLKGTNSDGNKTFNFTSKDSPISFGRNKDCSLSVPLSSISRVQTTFFFENNVWVIMDGDGKSPSTNGTWVFVDDYFKILDKMKAKAGNVIFKFNLIE